MGVKSEQKATRKLLILIPGSRNKGQRIVALKKQESVDIDSSKNEKSNEMKTRRILDNFHPWKKARPGSSEASKNRRLFKASQKLPIADNSLFPFQKAAYAERKPQSSNGPVKRCIFSQVIKEMQAEGIIGYHFTVKIFAPVKRNR